MVNERPEGGIGGLGESQMRRRINDIGRKRGNHRQNGMKEETVEKREKEC
jgi:hypothetical protein